MPTIILGTILGLSSAIVCAASGDTTLAEAIAIYTITGTSVVVLRLGLATSDHF